MVTGLAAGRFDAITMRGDFVERHASSYTIDTQSNGQLVNAQFPDSASLPGFGDNLLGTAFGHDKKALADAFVAAVKATVTDGTSPDLRQARGRPT